MRKFIFIFIMAVLLNLAPTAHATILDVTVDADLNSIFPGYYESVPPPYYSLGPLDTGLFLNLSDQLDISAAGTWSNAPLSYNLIFGPNGNPNENIAPTYPGAGRPVAALMGRIGNNSYFFIGSNYSNQVSQSGVLYLGFNDTDYGNNWGNVTAHITHTSAVPEPASLLLFGIGCVPMWFLKKRKPSTRPCRM